MKLAHATVTLCFFVVCNIAFSQTLKITSVSSPDRISGKLLEKQLVGKTLELTFYKDSATVAIAALHKNEKMKQTDTNQYTNINTASEQKSTSQLTLVKMLDKLSAIKLKLVTENEAGDKMEILIIAKPE
ncbi:MAG: hypothetical protein ACXVJB_05625 [Mucilaginibacter sp.]